MSKVPTKERLKCGFIDMSSTIIHTLLLYIDLINMMASGRMNPAFVSSLLLAFGLGALCTYLARNGANSDRPRRNAVDRAFYLGVVVEFPSVEVKDEFYKMFQPLADYVEQYELGTLSYEVLDSDKDTKRILILERYKDKEYYLNVHRSSKEFLKFRDLLQTLMSKGATLDGHSYIESGVGFI